MHMEEKSVSAIYHTVHTARLIPTDTSNYRCLSARAFLRVSTFCCFLLFYYTLANGFRKNNNRQSCVVTHAPVYYTKVMVSLSVDAKTLHESLKMMARLQQTSILSSKYFHN